MYYNPQNASHFLLFKIIPTSCNQNPFKVFYNLLLFPGQTESPLAVASVCPMGRNTLTTNPSTSGSSLEAARPSDTGVSRIPAEQKHQWPV